MPETTVHKLIIPPPRDGYLNDLILCWKERGYPSSGQINNPRYSKSINEVDCLDCWAVWTSLYSQELQAL